ncbi:MAG: hypothetical protein K2W78_06375 [Xanthobacteraceae bacterium]|nr:hypothetical protein [Xanthobacteraceae bacterium]
MRAVYIAMVFLLLATAGAAAIFLVGLPWLEPAKAVSDPKGDLGLIPLRSNFEVKSDRLALRAPDPNPVDAPLRPGMTLETAKHFMSVPLTGVPKTTPSKPTTALLDDQQIAAIKARLKLTPAQEKYWPPVEQALREVVSVAYNGRRPASTVDPEHDSVKRLMRAAGPFLAQLRSEQKEQIQSLMRVAGLGSELPGSN